MSHESYRDKHKDEFVNLISINVNKRNEDAVKNVASLGEFFELEKETKEIKNENKLLKHWNKIKK